MTYDNLIDQLEAIKKATCPAAPDDWQRYFAEGKGCTCAICALTRELLVTEIQGRQPITGIPSPGVNSGAE